MQSASLQMTEFPTGEKAALTRGETLNIRNVLLKRATRLVSKLRKGGVEDPDVMCVAQSLAVSDPSLLRTMSSDRLLRRHASILKARPGSAQTYAESSQTHKIDDFLSHNWTTSRRQKFFVLVLYFNWNGAILSYILFALLIGCLTAANWLPICKFQYGEDSDDSYTAGICNTVFSGVVFVVALFSIHEVRWRLKIGGRGVFLDKACIDQMDEARKTRGIQALGAFIRASQRFAVVYTGTYFRKLWTVYEIGTFLMLHPVDNLTIMPVVFPLVLFSAFFAANVFWISVALSRLQAINNLIFLLRVQVIGIAVLMMPPLILFATMLLRWSRTQTSMHDSLAAFDIRRAACAVEEDRAFVEANVASMVKAAGIVGAKSSHDEALVAFNNFIRTEVPKFLDDAFGRTGIRYRQAVVIFFPAFAFGLDVLGASIYEGSLAKRPVYISWRALEILSHVVGSGPLVIGLLAWGMKSVSQMEGWGLRVVITSSVSLAMFGLLAPFLFRRLLRPREDLLDFSSAVVCGIHIMILLLTQLVYRRRKPEAYLVARKRTQCCEMVDMDLSSELGISRSMTYQRTSSGFGTVLAKQQTSKSFATSKSNATTLSTITAPCRKQFPFTVTIEEKHFSPRCIGRTKSFDEKTWEVPQEVSIARLQMPPAAICSPWG